MNNDPPRRARRGDSGPLPVAHSMAKVLGRLGAPPSLDTMEMVFNRWPEVAGPELADHLQPVRVRGNVLVVGAEHPAWVTRCRIESERMLGTLRAMGDITIERIEVVLQRP
jgi:predicted nucleic acid-binding Zn ribbon protein